LFEGGAGEPAGVVDQAVELFVGADGVFDEGGALGFFADVDGVKLGAAAFVADCGGGFFAAVLLDVGEDYGGASLRIAAADFSPRSCWMSARITEAPSAAAWRAQAKPMPWAAPVMRMTLCWRRLDMERNS